MYEQFFSLTRTPFRLESEADMFFSGKGQQKTLHQIKQALAQRKSVITLSGLPGTGKTTLTRQAIEASIQSRTVICRINKAVVEQIGQTIETELNQRLRPHQSPDTPGIKTLLLASTKAKKHVFVIIDEAQRLTPQDLAYINAFIITANAIETSFTLFLTGPRHLNDLLQLDPLDQANDIHYTHCYLDPLDKNEIAAYVQHRLEITNWQDSPSFDQPIYDLIHAITAGIPRRINSFFDRLLLFSYVELKKAIDITTIKQFCSELLDELNQEIHPDLDTADLRDALRAEHHRFDDVNNHLAIAVSNNDHHSTTTTHYSHTESTMGSAGSNVSLFDEMRESLILVAKYFDNRERYKHYSDSRFELPEYIETLLFLSNEDDVVIKTITPPQLNNYTPQDICNMVRDFLRITLITANASAERSLGLNASSVDQSTIEKHYLRMMRLCNGDGQKTEPWSSQAKIQIREAYLSLLDAATQPIDTLTPSLEAHSIEKNIILPVNTDPHQITNIYQRLSSQPLEQISEQVHEPIHHSPISTTIIKQRQWLMTAATIIISLIILTITPMDYQNPSININQPVHPPPVPAETSTLKFVNETIPSQPEANDEVWPNPLITLLPATDINITRVDPPVTPTITPQATSIPTAPQTKTEPTIAKTSPDPTPSAISPKPKINIDNKSELTSAAAINQVSSQRPIDKTITTQSPKPNPSLNELNQLIADFIEAYEAGDLEGLTALFTTDAISNDTANRDKINKDYQKLFTLTSNRNIDITHFNWTTNITEAAGKGSFRVLLLTQDANELKEISGEITIATTTEHDQPKITSLFYDYHLAAN